MFAPAGPIVQMMFARGLTTLVQKHVGISLIISKAPHEGQSTKAPPSPLQKFQNSTKHM